MIGGEELPEVAGVLDDDIPGLVQVGDPFALPDEVDAGPEQPAMSAEEVKAIRDTLAGALQQYLEALDLPPTLWAPQGNVTPQQMFQLLVRAFNRQTKAARALVFQGFEVEMVLHGFPPELVNEVVRPIADRASQQLQFSLRGKSIQEMLEAYAPR